jgi:hypothetical protein
MYLFPTEPLDVNDPVRLRAESGRDMSFDCRREKSLRLRAEDDQEAFRNLIGTREFVKKGTINAQFTLDMI